MEESSKEEITKFPILFSIDKKGKTVEWRTWVEGKYSCHCFGHVGGKMREPIKREVSEVNSGKTNYRTAEEQAINFSRKSWAKQLDKGYKPADNDKEGVSMYEETMKSKDLQGGNNHQVLSGKSGLDVEKRINNLTVDHIDKNVLPMLAHKFLEKKDGFLNKKKKIPYLNFTSGVYVQPKLDGIRCIAKLQKNDSTSSQASTYSVVLTSRTGKQFVHLAHIREAIMNVLTKEKCKHIILDGELYVHDGLTIVGDDGNPRQAEYEERFNIITGACRTVRTKPHEYENQIQYHIFDLVDTENKYEQRERLNGLTQLFESYEGQVLQCVTTYEIFTEDEVYEHHNKFFKMGYEGVIIRDKKAMYTLKNRSPQLLKYKQFEDEEFLITGAKAGNGTEEGAVIWMCEKDGKKFECRPRGTIEKRKELYEDYTSYIGMLLTVRYQELSSDGIPRFPVGISIRNYE